MLHPHLRLKSSTCCAKKLKGRIYGKSLFAQLFCGLIFRYFPTDGLCASILQRKRKNKHGMKEKLKQTENALHRKNDPFQWKIKVEFMIAYSENL